MRIAICSSGCHKTPPDGYGSEVTAWYMVEELCKRGHEVWLFAAEGSRTPPNGKLFTMPLVIGSVMHEDAAAAGSLGELNSCDIVHDMSARHTFADIAHESGHDKHLTTINGISFITPRHKHNVVVGSEAARYAALNGTPAWGDDYPQFHLPVGAAGRLPSCEVVNYGVDTNFFAASPSHDDYIIYLGRPHPAKGVHRIIELAKLMSHQAFVLTWRAELPDHLWWEARYKEMARDVKNITIEVLPGPPEHHFRRRELYQRAKAFIQPTQYIEAFGITAIEALSCGLPVILADRGSAEEIVVQGETGFLCYDTMEEYTAAIGHVRVISRERCREDAVKRFDKGVMCERYLKLYERVLRGDEW